MKNLIPTIVLVTLLLIGTAIMFWFAGFFEQSEQLFCPQEFVIDTHGKGCPFFEGFIIYSDGRCTFSPN